MIKDDPARFLLLVPPTSEVSLQALKLAYGETITDVLKEVALHSNDSQGAAILEIALACPHLVDVKSTRSQLFPQTQRLVALLYKLTVVIAAKHDIDVEDESGVDVRIILVAWSALASKPASTSGHGPVIDIETLAKSGRPWEHAFGVESGDGISMLKAFLNAKEGAKQINQGDTPESETTQNDTCRDVAVGGTFDHLHIGHKLLLLMTLFTIDDSPLPRSITIGITGDELLKNKKHAEVLESWSQRQKAVEDFCDAMLDFSQFPSKKLITSKNEPGPNGKSVDLHYANKIVVRCTEIQDPFGPTITDESISALVISAETRSGGKAVNDKRTEKGWKPLNVLEVDVLDADEEDAPKDGFDAKLSSTAIRKKLATATRSVQS